MSRTALKQYIEKELQTKKFLVEAFDLLTELETLESDKVSYVRLAEEAKQSYNQGLAQLKDVKSDLDAAKEKQNAADKLAAETVAKAEERAKAIVAKAEAMAVQKTSGADAKLMELEEQIALLQNKKALHNAETDAAKKELDAINADRERILKKYV